eukprot:2730711-Amphidinium_carterae.1
MSARSQACLPGRRLSKTLAKVGAHCDDGPPRLQALPARGRLRCVRQKMLATSHTSCACHGAPPAAHSGSR